MRFNRACVLLVVAALNCAALCRAEQMMVAPDRTNGVYASRRYRALAGGLDWRSAGLAGCGSVFSKTD